MFHETNKDQLLMINHMRIQMVDSSQQWNDKKIQNILETNEQY